MLLKLTRSTFTAVTRTCGATAAVRVARNSLVWSRALFAYQIVAPTLPREKGMALEAEFARAGLFLARVGAVTDGSGVALA